MLTSSLPDGGDRSRVTLTGFCRPPLGTLGERLDRLILHTVATTTIPTLLTRIAAALEGAPRLPSRTRCGSPGLRPEPAVGCRLTPSQTEL
jgi:hypothetical protein